MLRRRALLLAPVLACALAPATASAAVTLQPGTPRFTSPMYAAFPPRDKRRMFVVERGGKVWIVKDGVKLAQPFLDISAEVGGAGEQGLMTMAFAPDFETSQ